MIKDIKELSSLFPFDTFRDGQEDCITHIIEQFQSGKKYFILEAPTGSGKSAIGLTVAKFFDNAFYLTVQKILQTQIIEDYIVNNKEDIVELKGRNNYPCTFYETHGNKLLGVLFNEHQLNKIKNEKPDCEVGFCRERGDYKCKWCFKKSPDTEKQFGVLNKLPIGMSYSACPYYEQLGRAMNSHTCLMNFSSFLFQSMVKDRFPKRNLMVIDESHQLEQQILNFTSVTVNDVALQEFKFKIPEFQSAEEYWLYFLEHNLSDKLDQLVGEAYAQKKIKVAEKYQSMAIKVRKFDTAMQMQEDWVAEFTGGKDSNAVTLKPVFVTDKAHELVFDKADHVLFMSATILDANIYKKSLGIPNRDVSSFRMKNRFPAKNRPIYFRDAGKFTGGVAKMKEWGPKLVKEADKAISENIGVRGIIHTHNFAILNLLKEKSAHKSRFLLQEDFDSKEDLLDEHSKRKDTIIVAPAMHEGLDLKDELSRFQIICKIPWPNFINDKQMSRRVDVDPDFFVWTTAIKLMQSYGRSIRSETDWAKTYVIDGGFDGFINDRASSLIPQWFKEAISW